MDDFERENGVDYPLRQYDARLFVTVDARQLAFNNYETALMSQSGLTGGTPAMTMIGAEPPRGFNYTLTSNGLGGTPSPNAMGDSTPLVLRPEFAETFIRNSGGYGGSLY